MVLPGTQLRLLHTALLAAFPVKAELARIVRGALDVDLDTIASGASRAAAYFALLVWADAQDQLPALLDAVLVGHPTHPSLRTAAAALTDQTPPAGPASAARPTVAAALEGTDTALPQTPTTRIPSLTVA